MDNQIKFSVLMSVYYKEKPEYLQECLESLLRQTTLADEWVIVKDGPLSPELDEVLEKYCSKYPGLIKFVILKENKGLGLALRQGVLECSNEIIARMDTDDIAVEERFEKQLKEISAKDVDVCGSHIKEFYGDITNILSVRKVPTKHEEIVNYQKRRSAFNHMTVMYKKSAVLRAGNYEHAPLMEDDMLWVKMLMSGSKASNIDEYLVYARTGLEMIDRRGGLGYLKKYKQARKKIYKTGYISYWDYIYTILVNFVVCIIPSKIRQFVFLKLLR